MRCPGFTLSQSRDGPDRYGAVSRFDTMPSRPAEMTHVGIERFGAGADVAEHHAERRNAAAVAIRISCWWETRTITLVSAFQPRPPAPCSCRGRSSGTACSAFRLRAKGARPRASSAPPGPRHRGLHRRHAGPSPKCATVTRRLISSVIYRLQARAVPILSLRANACVFCALPELF
jgi:hypothetical protein